MFFLHPINELFNGHAILDETQTLIEFQDSLKQGILFPHWATHARHGLGSPLLLFKQPGYYYIASPLSWIFPPIRALGITMFAFAFLGFITTYIFVRHIFSAGSGWLAANLLLLSPYTGTNLAIRADLSEFAAMMTVPALFFSFYSFFYSTRKLKSLIFIALLSGFLIPLHPHVALYSIGLLSLTCLITIFIPSLTKQTIYAIIALAIGISLGAFYWFPVLLELPYVSSEFMLSNFYHYSNHFISPKEFFQPYNRNSLIPFTLSPIVVFFISATIISLFTQWKNYNKSQKLLLLYSLTALGMFSFLTTQQSMPLWNHLPILQLTVFPWRMLSIITVLSTVSVVGLITLAHKPMPLIFAATIILLFLSPTYTKYSIDKSISTPQNISDLEHQTFPTRDEFAWIPKNASPSIPLSQTKKIMPSDNLIVTSFKRSQGLLTAQVKTEGEASLTLPHYYYPVGWQAEINNKPISLSSSAQGLMQINLPDKTNGTLKVSFKTTPMRKIGFIISASSLFLGILLVLTTIIVAQKKHSQITHHAPQ